MDLYSFGLLLLAVLYLHAQNLEAGCKKTLWLSSCHIMSVCRLYIILAPRAPWHWFPLLMVGVTRLCSLLYFLAHFFRAFLFTPGVPLLPILCRLHEGLSSRPATFKDCRLPVGQAIFRKRSTRMAHSTWQHTRAEHKGSLCTERLVNSAPSGAERQARADSGGTAKQQGCFGQLQPVSRHLRASQCPG